MTEQPSDPVLARRARIVLVVGRAKAVGYGLLGLAIVVFAIGLAISFPPPLVEVTVGALVASTVILPIPIVLGYGIRAAEREERRAR